MRVLTRPEFKVWPDSGGIVCMSDASQSLRPSAPPSNDTDELQINDWDEYFLELACAVSRKSKDPTCRVGAVLVSADNIVLTTGFNGLARGIYDNKTILETQDEKLDWICHAEVNAIYNAARIGASLRGCTIYVTKFPCFACSNAIVQAGIKRIYTHDDKDWDKDPFDGPPHSKKPELFRQAKIEVDAHYHSRYAPTRQRLAKTRRA
jgi:dCMP deaminase